MSTELLVIAGPTAVAEEGYSGSVSSFHLIPPNPNTLISTRDIQLAVSTVFQVVTGILLATP